MMLHRSIYNIIRRTIFTNSKIYCTLQNTLNVNFKQYYLCRSYLYSQYNFNLIFKRFKSKEECSKHDKYNDENKDEDESLDVDEYLHTKGSKIIEGTVPSLRLDAVAKLGLGMSRVKLNQEFYKSNVRVNGKKCLKKNTMVQIGDEIDVVLRQSPDNPRFLLVDRCILVSVNVVSESIKVKMIQNKSLLIEDYEDPWSGIK